MKKHLLLFAIVSLALPAVGVKKNLKTVKIQVVSQAEEMGHKFGSSGSIIGRRTFSEVYMVNAIIEGDKARLKCFENHQGCTAIGPGFYDAEIDLRGKAEYGGNGHKGNGADVWILVRMPITHQIVRDHWKVSGTWGTETTPAEAKSGEPNPSTATVTRVQKPAPAIQTAAAALGTSATPAAASSFSPNYYPDIPLGMRLKQDNYGLKVIEVLPDGIAAQKGIGEDDYIYAIDGRRVRTVAELRAAVAANSTGTIKITRLISGLWAAKDVEVTIK
jgi:hypothetical protein